MTNIASSDQRAGWEHIWTSGDIPPRYRTFAEPSASVVEWADTVLQGGFILDVGCGVGRHVVYLGGRGFLMAGVDISPSGIKRTQDVCAEQLIGFDGRVSDMTTLPWGNNTFDAALSIATIHHHRRVDIARALDEVRRVLKPGGLFLVDFPCTDTFIYQQLRQQVASGQLVEVEPNTFVDERPHSEDPDGFLPHHFCDEADLRDLLKGFDMLRLWADLREVTLENGETGKIGRWVAWVSRPLSS